MNQARVSGESGNRVVREVGTLSTAFKGWGWGWVGTRYFTIPRVSGDPHNIQPKR